MLLVQNIVSYVPDQMFVAWIIEVPSFHQARSHDFYIWLQFIESLQCVVVLLNIAWSFYWRATLFSRVSQIQFDQDHGSLAEAGAVQWTFSTIANDAVSLRKDPKCVMRRELLGKSETAHRRSADSRSKVGRLSTGGRPIVCRPAKLHLIHTTGG